MKNINIILLALALAFSSCGKDEEIDFQTINYLGAYTGKLFCANQFEVENYESLDMIVQQDISNEAYLVNFGDGSIFKAYDNGTSLVIDKQTIRENQDFDVVTLSGIITQIENNLFSMDLSYEVDDEGSFDCTSSLNKF